MSQSYSHSLISKIRMCPSTWMVRIHALPNPFNHSTWPEPIQMQYINKLS